MNRNPHLASLAAGDAEQFRRRCAAFIQLDSLRQRLEMFAGHHFAARDTIGLRDAVARMHQPVGEFAIIRQE